MTYEVYLAHHGIKGQRWGVRRYQNEDGTYTELGKKHYAKEVKRAEARNDANANKAQRAQISRENYRKAVNMQYHRSTRDRLYRAKGRGDRRYRRNIRRNVKYFQKTVSSLQKKGYKDKELDPFVKKANEYLEQRKIAQASKHSGLNFKLTDSANKAYQEYISFQDEIAKKSKKPSSGSTRFGYFYDTHPFRRG